METLTLEDTQKLHQGIQKIYTLHNLDTFGVDFLEIVERLVPSDRLLFNLTNFQPTGWKELDRANTTLIWSILNRPGCSYTERDRLILNLLCPHLFQAYNNAQKFDRLQQETRQIQRSLDRLGVISEQTLSSLNSLELLGLSQRETEVLALVMQGKNNKSIAIQLNIHISTVCKHLENIYPKLGARSRTEAIAQALAKLGLLPIDAA
jgi:DNA-binding CsgD family transcriptional regulator